MFCIAKFQVDFASADCYTNMQCRVDEASINTLEIWNGPERYVKQIYLEREF